jgi:Na+/proline symporter
VVVVVLGLLMIVYTMRGGARPVIWTDVIQLVRLPARRRDPRRRRC